MPAGPTDPDSIDRRDALDSALIRLYRLTRDPQRLERLFERFGPLLTSSVGAHARADEAFEDVMQFALLGLLKALERYDPDDGTGFATFARTSINAEIAARSLPPADAARLRRGRKTLQRRLQAARRETPAAGLAELADRLGVSPCELLDAEQAPGTWTSPASDPAHGGPAVGGLASVARSGEPDGEEVRIAFSLLGVRDRRARPLRFVDAAVRDEVRGQTDVSAVEVSRVLNRALDLLRVELHARLASAASDDLSLRTP
jgi:RNA polymerase sigma-B factor